METDLKELLRQINHDLDYYAVNDENLTADAVLEHLKDLVVIIEKAGTGETNGDH